MEMEGHIIEFIDSGSLRVGYVRKQERSRLQIIDRRGRQSSALSSRVVIVHLRIREDQFSEKAVELLEEVEERRRRQRLSATYYYYYYYTLFPDSGLKAP